MYKSNNPVKEASSHSVYSSLFKEYYPPLLFYAMRFLDEEEAEDVVQDVFLTLWKRRDELEVGPYISSFLYRSVYTRSLNMLSKKKVANNYCKDLEDIYTKKMEYYHPDNTEVIQRIENNELRTEMLSVINALPEKCKEVFKLSYLHELKNKEIAEALDISVRTVEAHMYKALKLLRERLKHLVVLLWILLTQF